MVDKIEMSLDEIIKSNRGQKRPGRGGSVGGGRGAGGTRRGAAARRRQGDVISPRKAVGGGGVLKGRNRGGGIQKQKFTRGDVNSAWKHDLFDGPRGRNAISTRGPPGNNEAAKLLVSNLDYGVSNTDIQELFSEFGPLKKAAVHYDRSGRSLGTADVIFERRSDALKAIKQYNNVPLDGRPMNIQLAISDVAALARTVRPTNGAGGGASVMPASSRHRQTGLPSRRGTGSIRRGGQNRNRAGAAADNSGRRGRGVAPTAEELDAELDAYVNDMKI